MTARFRACALALLAAAALGACNPTPEPASAPASARIDKALPSADLGEELRAFDRDVLERLRRLPDPRLIPEERRALAKGTTYDVYYGGASTGTAQDGLYEGGKYSDGTKYISFAVSSVVTAIGTRSR